MRYQIKRERLEHYSYKPIESFFTTYIWAMDGWTYNVNEKKRQRYFYHDDKLYIEEEPYIYLSFPMCLHREEIRKHIISYEPLKWIEEGIDFKELYVSLGDK